MCHHRGSRRWIGLLLLGVICCVSGLSGCGVTKKKAIVFGKVSYQGETLGNGKVVFIGKDGKGDESTIKADGSYRITNAPIGPVKITVTTTPPPKTSLGIANAPEMPSMSGGAGKAETPGKYVKIPDKYNDPDKTPLTYEVKSGEQPKDITLE